MSTTPPAGWYPDNGSDGLRYWDGQKVDRAHLAGSAVDAGS